MAADVDGDRAVEGAYAALHAARRIRGDLSLDHAGVARLFFVKEFFEHRSASGKKKPLGW